MLLLCLHFLALQLKFAVEAMLLSLDCQKSTEALSADRFNVSKHRHKQHVRSCRYYALRRKHDVRGRYRTK